jgi:ABC-2 type transport system ATP-binding protein
MVTDNADIAIMTRSLRVVRGGADILREIDLTVPVGTVYGLVGPSGSGKTTLIRAFVGLQRITSGEVHVLGRPAGTAELRSDIGYMPQEAGIYTDLTGRENLEFFGGICRVPVSRVDAVLDLLDIDAAADRPVSTYSGGQRRRIALGVALLAEPRLLFLDEPTVGLDPRLRHRLWAQFKTWANGGTTLIVTTHVMDEASRTDRLAFIVEGRIVAEGTPAELLSQTGAENLEGAVLQLAGSVAPV